MLILKIVSWAVYIDRLQGAVQVGYSKESYIKSNKDKKYRKKIGKKGLKYRVGASVEMQKNMAYQNLNFKMIEVLIVLELVFLTYKLLQD